MARKLSRIARRGCWILTIAGPLAVDGVFAQDGIHVSSSPNVVPNPFAARIGEPESRAIGQKSPGRGPVSFHNPFSAMSGYPPIDMPVRPGPVSRWRRPAALLDESPVKNAVLSTDAVEHTRIPWDQLPPAESLRERAAMRDSSAKSSGAARGHLTKPGNFAAQPLVQPEWVAPDGPVNGVRQTAGQIAFHEPAVHDPFEQPNGSGPMMVAAGDAESGKNSLLYNSSRAIPASGIAQPLIISDYSEAPDGCLAQAQQRAQTAESVDELSAVASLCQRGLASGPQPELATPLRRLAAWAHNRRGELLIDQDRAAEAIKDFQVAISLDPNCSLAIHNRAVTLAQQNETDAALRDFNRVIELNPGLAIAYRNRAELLASLGRFNEAVGDYDRAIDGLPDDAALYRARGCAWHRLGNLPQSFADLDRSIQLEPNNPDAFTERGNLEAERGNFNKAINDLRQAVALDPQWTEAYRSLAWLHATCPNPRYRNPEEALAAAKEAAKLSPPDDSFVLDALAAAYASGGDFEEAVRLQEQAIAVAPPDFAEPLQQRLALYQQGQPFVSGPEPAVRAALHEAR